MSSSSSLPSDVVDGAPLIQRDEVYLVVGDGTAVVRLFADSLLPHAQGCRVFSSISDPALIQSLQREGEPVEGDATVFRWRGQLMLQPYWSKGFLIVR